MYDKRSANERNAPSVDESEDVLSGIGSTTRSLEDALSLDEDSDDGSEKEDDDVYPQQDRPKKDSDVPLMLPLGILLPRSPARLFVHNCGLHSASAFRSANTSPLVTPTPIRSIPLSQSAPASTFNWSDVSSFLSSSPASVLPPESEVDLTEEELARESPDDIQPTLDWDEHVDSAPEITVPVDTLPANDVITISATHPQEIVAEIVQNGQTDDTRVTADAMPADDVITVSATNPQEIVAETELCEDQSKMEDTVQDGQTGDTQVAVDTLPVDDVIPTSVTNPQEIVAETELCEDQSKMEDTVQDSQTEDTKVAVDTLPADDVIPTSATHPEEIVASEARDSGVCGLMNRCDSGADETCVMYTSDDDYLSPASESGGYHTPTLVTYNHSQEDFGKLTIM